MSVERPEVSTTTAAEIALDQPGKVGARRVPALRHKPTAPPTQEKGMAESEMSPSETTASPATASNECAATKEKELDASIKVLWAKDVKRDARVKKTSVALKKLRCELGAKLSELKKLVCVPGRQGGWTAKCAELGIAKRTADRLAKNHDNAQAKESVNVASGQNHEPWTEEEVRKIATKIAAKIGGRLGGTMTSEVALALFQDAMQSALSTSVRVEG